MNELALQGNESMTYSNLFGMIKKIEYLKFEGANSPLSPLNERCAAILKSSNAHTLGVIGAVCMVPMVVIALRVTAIVLEWKNNSFKAALKQAAADLFALRLVVTVVCAKESHITKKRAAFYLRSQKELVSSF